MINHRIRRMEVFLNRLASVRRGRTSVPPRRLQTAADVIDLLHEQVEAIRRESWAETLDKARAIGYLAVIARKAIETGTLAARLEMLEAILKQRKESDPR